MDDNSIMKPESEVYSILAALVKAACDAGIIEIFDRTYAYNRLLSCLKLDSSNQPDFSAEHKSNTIAECIDRLIKYAVEEKVIENIFDYKEILAADMMNCLMSRPSEINRYFNQLRAVSPEQATDWFYQYCQDVQYIQVSRTSKNITYQATSEYGVLDITINISKPEKNPADIAAERNIIRSDYPRCLLCAENEGYKGRIGHPARSNHRLIRLSDLAGEQWFFQYSPYSYYNEHCIVLSSEHRPMKIDRQTFVRIFAFLDRFPHYFIGSNADLPIVGGSILSHDHYQGGRYSFAMDKAPVEHYFSLPSYPGVTAGIVKWPMSVLRLQGSDKDELTNCCEAILAHWRQYDDFAVSIMSHSANEPHNTITPIGRKRGERFEMDLVLRNNRCSDEHPLGIFHPHDDVHHIKKENIGLIEVMGLAVLPARLVEELAQVSAVLTGENKEVSKIHSLWAHELVHKYGNNNSSELSSEIVRRETAVKFERVLADAGVFKRDEKGQAAFAKFIKNLADSV